jgi:hypothetical protein
MRASTSTCGRAGSWSTSGAAVIDLAIRYGRGRWPGAEASRLLGEVLFPVCVPALTMVSGTISDGTENRLGAGKTEV